MEKYQKSRTERLILFTLATGCAAVAIFFFPFFPNWISILSTMLCAASVVLACGPRIAWLLHYLFRNPWRRVEHSQWQTKAMLFRSLCAHTEQTIQMVTTMVPEFLTDSGVVGALHRAMEQGVEVEVVCSDYGQSDTNAFLATLRVERPHFLRAYQDALRSGSLRLYVGSSPTSRFYLFDKDSLIRVGSPTPYAVDERWRWRAHTAMEGDEQAVRFEELREARKAIRFQDFDFSILPVS